MSIKSDNWIRRMAREHRLIEPFEPQQVRSGAGGRLISYGTSSYGYDVRCASEFKIFTNINSTIVDPKRFDEKSFVDMKGDVCIIPPNSFALARTVEYFRIPRNVLTVCLGKCVTGDTRVVDAETGGYVPITQMRWGKSTLAMDGWRLRGAKVSEFIPQGMREVFQLRTCAGLSIRATANHPFRTFDGWKALSTLKAGDRIAVAREIPVFGKTPLPDWEATLLGLMISEGQCHTPGHSPTFTSADPALVQLFEDAVSTACFGILDHNRAHTWLERRGLCASAADRFVPQCIFTAPEPSVRLFLQALFTGDGSIYSSGGGHALEHDSKSQRLIEDVHHLLLRFGVFASIRNRATAIGTPAWRIQITDKDQIQRFAERIGFVRGSAKHERLVGQVLPLIQRDSIAGNASQSVCMSAGRTLSATIDPQVRSVSAQPLWDIVESIEAAGSEEVFDISVPGLHNFVANGMIVHNSTYARCFRGDTRVALVDGTSATLEDMARRSDRGELFWGYSIGANGRLIVTLLDQPRFVARDALIEITLDNGERIRATPDHGFLRRDGTVTLAADLRPGDSLMPLYRQLRRGYEYVYQPISGHLLATYRLADEWVRVAGPESNSDPGRRSRQAEIARQINLRSEITADTVRKALDQAGSIRGAARYLECDRSVFRRFPEVVDSFRGITHRNHKVIAIRELPGEHDVYCLTVPEAGNFALEAGVFVRNCGIIVNVTPLEPEWEGHVTLEFSNTTPLPAKIYANEGVAQMLFFESDEVCSTSYADRGGKYQGQQGVTLPKA